MSVAVRNAMPTLSQLRDWQTEHLTDAGSRWRAAADTWTSVHREVAEGLVAPAGTTWDGPASKAAHARMTRYQTGVDAVAARLMLGARIAEGGARVIEAAKQRALTIVAATNALGFDVQEDLSVVDRLPFNAFRVRQGSLLALEIKRASAWLAAIDQSVGTDISTATTGFDAIDFVQGPMVEPLDTPDRNFGQCFGENFSDDIGPYMVRGAFTGGLAGAVIGGLGGAFFGGPVGAAGGVVLGFVGGAAKGVMITGPLEAAGKAVWDCW